jgi:hypothetical protein
MAKLPTRTSAESLLFQSMKRAASLKQEQDREYEAMVLKTTRLRELRLAKEAADREAATPTVRRALWPSLVADEPDEASKPSAAPGNALGRACVSSAYADPFSAIVTARTSCGERQR